MPTRRHTVGPQRKINTAFAAVGESGDVCNDAPGLVAREYTRLPCLVLFLAEVCVGDGLAVRVGHDERLLKLTDGPGAGKRRVIWRRTSGTQSFGGERGAEGLSQKLAGEETHAMTLSYGQRRGPIQQGAAISVVDVFPDEHVACGGDLPLELNHLALNCSFFLLRVRAHTRV